MQGQYSDFFIRPISTLCEESKGEYIEEIKSLNFEKDDVQLQYLFSDSFTHHTKLNCLGKEIISLELLKNDPKRIISEDDLTKYFIRKIYNHPSIYNTDSYNEYEKKQSKIDLSAFISLVSANPITDYSNNNTDLGTNRFSYLIGNVGDGKTTLIMKAIDEIHISGKDYDNFTLIPIYIDLDNYVLPGGRLKDVDNEFYINLYLNTYRAISINKKCIKYTKLEDIYCNPHKLDPIYCLQQLYGYLARKSIRLIYFIDNVDRYHFYYTRYSFFPEYLHEQTKSVVGNLSGLIGKFTNLQSSELGSCGLCVVMSCRKYVYQHLRYTNDPATPREDFSSVFQIGSTPDSEIVGSRFKLFTKAISTVKENIPGRSKNWDIALREIRALITVENLSSKIQPQKNKKNINIGQFDTIRRLSHHGNRSFVKFISSLKLNYKNYTVMERLLSSQPRTLTILYINNLRKRYTQEQMHFPNMFLNDSMIWNNKEFPNAHKEHKHTYWLKYLLLKFIYKKTKTTIEEIENVFVDDGGYERHLVRLVLGSLCTANDFRCAEVDCTLSNTEICQRHIVPTERGKYLMTEIIKNINGDIISIDFCFSFIYLQLVIDDYLLSLPTPWADDIFTDSNYDYLYRQESEYGYGVSKQIKTKGNAIIYFLNILKNSFEIEYSRKKKMFDYLKQEEMLPDFDTIKKSILFELKNVLDSTNNANKYSELTSLYSLEESKSSYKEFFINYCNSKILVS